MRLRRLCAAGLWLAAANAVAQTDAPSPPEPAGREAADVTAQQPGAAGWDGRLPGFPEAAQDPRSSLFGGGLTLYIDNSLHLYGDARRRHDEPRYPLGPYGLPGCTNTIDDGRGRAGTAGVIGGTFGRVTRCADGYPGLPLRYGDTPR